MALVIPPVFKLTVSDANEIPVFEGEAEPLERELETAEWVHGTDGLNFVPFPEPSKEAEGPGAVEFLRDTLENSDEKITLAVLGPMTNIGKLIRDFPNTKNKIEKIVFMGGGAGMGNHTPVAEFNILVDPEAADIVLSSLSASSVLDEGMDLYNFDGDFLGIIKSQNTSTNTITLYDVNENAVVAGTKPRVNSTHIRQGYPNRHIVSGTVNDMTYPLWKVYPKLLTLANRFDWAYKPDGTDASSGGEHLGFTLNGLNRAQDYLELIDPKCTKYHLFGKSDLYPECANRKRSLFYGNRDITNYNLMLKTKGETEESTGPDGYSGAATKQTYKDDTYETVVIEQSNKELNDNYPEKVINQQLLKRSLKSKHKNRKRLN